MRIAYYVCLLTKHLSKIIRLNYLESDVTQHRPEGQQKIHSRYPRELRRNTCSAKQPKIIKNICLTLV